MLEICKGNFQKPWINICFYCGSQTCPRYLRVGFTSFCLKAEVMWVGITRDSAQDEHPFSCREIQAFVVSSFLLLSWLPCCPTTSLPTGFWMTKELQEASFKRWHAEVESDIYLCVACWSRCQCAMSTEKDLVASECNCEATQKECPGHRAPASLPSSCSDFISADLQQKGQKLRGTLLRYFRLLFMPRFTEWTIRKNSAKLWKGIRHNFTRCFYTLCFCLLALCKHKLSPPLRFWKMPAMTGVALPLFIYFHSSCVFDNSAPFCVFLIYTLQYGLFRGFW